MEKYEIQLLPKQIFQIQNEINLTQYSFEAYLKVRQVGIYQSFEKVIIFTSFLTRLILI